MHTEFTSRTDGLINRRSALRLFAGAGTAMLAACSSSSKSAVKSALNTSTSSVRSNPSVDTDSTDTSTASSESSTSTSCSTIPEETAGPYPGDGSNGPDILTKDGVVRRDIRKSLATGTTAEGIPVTLKFLLQDTANGCAPLAAAAVYVWHCDRDGDYSMYAQGLADEDYLRGVQPADASGTVTFQTIFPGCYDGRWPHMHFEVYESESAATSGGTILKTSQLAVPRSTCEVAYATDGYSSSANNLGGVSLDSDMVFGDDGAVHELATVTGSPSDGYTFTLTVPV